jgi:TM2 domain-containing membrane protein YozV
MAEILRIENDKVKIGTDNGKVVTVPIATIGYANPKEGDKVKVYKDGNSYIIKKQESITDSVYQTGNNGTKSINKHVFVWVANFLFGGFGVDRFLRGQIGLGVCKLLFGWLTLGIWPLVDWIISLSKAYGGAYGNTENLTFDAQGNYTK